MSAVLIAVSMFFCSCDWEINGIKESVPKEINNTSPTEAKAGIANPVEIQDSIDDVNEKAGTGMKDVDAEDVVYSTIKADVVIGQVQFTYKDADFTYRAAKTEGDISGVYAQFDGEIQAAGDAAAKNQSPKAISDTEFYARWFSDDGVQYSLYSDGAVRADFEMMYDELK